MAAHDPRQAVSVLASAVAALAFGLAVWTPPANAQAPGCDPADECCSQCDVSWTVAGICPNDIPFEDYDDLDTTRASLLAIQAQSGCGYPSLLAGLVEGVCTNGHQWIYDFGYAYQHVRFFDSSGAFLSEAHVGDFASPETCGSQTHYPALAICYAPTVTQIHCWENVPVYFDTAVVGEQIILPGIDESPSAPVMDPRLLIPVLCGLGWVRLRRSRADADSAQQLSLAAQPGSTPRRPAPRTRP